MTGTFTGTKNFDPSDGEDWHGTPYESRIFVTKLGPDGSYTWTRSFAATSSGSLRSSEGIAVEAFGDIVVTGSFDRTRDFDPTDGTDCHSCNGSRDVFVTKLSPNGDYCWTRTFGAKGIERARDLAVDHKDNIFVVGHFDDYGQATPYIVDFDPTVGVDFHVCHTGPDAFVTKLRDDGSYVWTLTIASLAALPRGIFGAQEYAEAVTIDEAGNPLIIGTFASTWPVDCDPTHGTDWRVGGDLFVTRLHADGSYAWTAVISGSDRFEAYDLAVDHQGNVFLGGEFGGTADLDPTDGEDQYSTGDKYLGFITKIERGAVPFIIADADHDAHVRFSDLDALACHWLDVDCQNHKWCDWADFNRNTKVDFADFAILTEYWLSGFTY